MDLEIKMIEEVIKNQSIKSSIFLPTTNEALYGTYLSIFIAFAFLSYEFLIDFYDGEYCG